MFDLQTTFTLCRTVDESQASRIYNSQCDLFGVKNSFQYENVDVLALKLIYTQSNMPNCLA